MWKPRSDEKPYSPPPAPQTSATPAPTSTPSQPKSVLTPTQRPMESSRMDNFRTEVAHIGKSVVIKGELSGSEDLYLDGEVEGSVELRGHSLTIGPNGRVRANIHAREVIIHGRVDGKVHGIERVELKKTSTLAGDIVTQRIVIEDGAFFKGAIDIEKATGTTKTEPSAEPKREVAPVAPSVSAAAAVPVGAGAQSSLIDRN